MAVTVGAADSCGVLMAEDPEDDPEGVELGPEFDAGPFVAAPLEPWEVLPERPPQSREECHRIAMELLRKYCKKRPEGEADRPFIVGPG